MSVIVIRKDALDKYTVRKEGPHNLMGAASKLEHELAKRFR